jgi:divalent metal cation (Fe/Co/Zn/Cd) transporter
MLMETLSKILGERVDSDLAVQIKRTINEFEGVHGSYDLILHNYGPDTLIGSVHVEIPDTWDAHQIDELTRKIQKKIYCDYGVVMTAVGVYSMNTRDDFAAQVRTDVTEIVMSHDHVLQMHGFYLLKEEKTMRFDLVVSFDAKDRRAVFNEAVADVQKAFPEYQLQTAMDTDFTEE